MGELYQCSCLGCAVGLPHLAASDQPLFTDAELDAFLQAIHDGDFNDGTFSMPRAEGYADHFNKAIADGYGKSLSNVDYETPDAKMLQSLADNVFHFSAAKTRAEIVSLSSALRDESGAIRSFAEFRRAAAGITGEFTGSWLRTEYDNALGAAQMAARWVDYEDSPHAWLVYRTVGDARVREAHRELDGITRHREDPFWKTYYPPNGWNCRCDVQQTTANGDRGSVPGGAIDGVPPMFRVNLAKEGWAFPADHPYYDAMTPRADKQLRDKKKEDGQ